MDLLVRFGDYELDEARFELRKAGQPLTVQPKLLELLVYLAREHRRVVPKQELFEHIWPGVRVSEGSLSQAVSLVRKLLGDSPDAQRHIRTVRGRGFQFVAPVRDIALSSPSLRPPQDASKSTVELDTSEHGSHSTARTAPHLFVVLHAHTPWLGAARYALSGVDEVVLGRGTERRAELHEQDMTRCLRLALPDEAMSREHLQLVRTREGWCSLDQGSKNGTVVNGERIRRALLRDGDLIELGRTYLIFRNQLPTPATSAPIDERRGGDSALATLLPEWQALPPSALPQLHERREDLGWLLAERLRAAGRPDLRFSADAGRALLRHDWARGLAELDWLVGRLVAGDEGLITGAALEQAWSADVAASATR